MLSEESMVIAADSGMDVDCKAFIAIRFLDEMLIRSQLSRLPDNVQAIFTSVNSVKAVAENLQNNFCFSTVFCINGATKTAVEAAFPKCEIIFAEKNADELKAHIVRENKGIPIVFFCGKSRLDTLPNAMKAAQITFEEIMLYETKATPVAINSNYDAVLFFSPTGVESFFSINNLNEKTVAVAIGKTTSKALASYAENIVEADFPDEKSMLELAASTLQKI